MQDWSKYIERPIVEVLPELEAEGYRVTSDECVIFGQRNIDIEKGDVVGIIGKNGEVLHTGKTKNMGKVFSNYVNCAKYHQSYDFNLDGGDKLLFKESAI